MTDAAGPPLIDTSATPAGTRVLSELVSLLTLERIEKNLFRGASQDLGWGTVFGGQVLGQALAAAVETVPADRVVHSLHAYFLRPGDVKSPIVYDVDRIRDGSSFTTRRVVAIQNGEAIFNLAASFQTAEAGLEHADVMPDVPPPEAVISETERLERASSNAPSGSADHNRIASFLRGYAKMPRPFEHRPIDPPSNPSAPVDLLRPAPRPPERAVWFRAVGPLPDSTTLHACLLAYASDFMFLGTALLPHGVSWLTPGMQVASLDHVMWFHGPFRVDDWLLYVMDSPSASGARGLVRGRIFTRDGRLIATTSQEGLIRKRA